MNPASPRMAGCYGRSLDCATRGQERDGRSRVIAPPGKGRQGERGGQPTLMGRHFDCQANGVYTRAPRTPVAMLKRFLIGFALGVGGMYWAIHNGDRLLSHTAAWVSRSAGQFRGDQDRQSVDRQLGAAH